MADPDPTANEPTVVGLVAEALKHLEDGGDAALEGFLSRHAEHARVLRERLDVLRKTGLLGGAGGAEIRVPDKLGEFLLQERIGAGGMGFVFRALQPSLQRTVALKVIRPENLFFPSLRERFRREVEAIARLEHPAIVRVYEVGEASGLPYFTMEHVEGLSLARLLELLDERGLERVDDGVLRTLLEEQRDAGSPVPLLEATGRAWVELCVQWARDVAEALDHAHRAGILHRDVKPSNVMLTWSGRVLLLDFGLASVSGGERITRTGSLAGSLPYMAPEQLRGEAATDARTDVYALGVTLYEMLARAHPFGGRRESVEVLRGRILDGNARPLRSVRSGITWDVETVCMTAMDVERTRRYPSAEAFARDLGNVLRLRPIEARRPGPALRARRFAQRHPAWTTGVLLGLALVLGGPLALWRAQVEKTRAVQAEQQKTSAALAEVRQHQELLEQQKVLAERRFETAVAAVSEVLREIGYLELRDVPRAGPVRRRLLEIADRSARELVAEIPDHAGARELAAWIQQLLGRVALDAGELPAALASLERSAEALGDLCGASEEPEVSLLLKYGITLNLLGLRAFDAGDFPEAEERFLDAIAVYESSLETLPEGEAQGSILEQLGVSLMNLGNMKVRAGDEEGEELLEEARGALEEALAQSPAVTVRENLATLFNNLGKMAHDAQRWDEALDHYRRSLELQDSVSKELGGERRHRYERAVVLSNMGLVLQIQRRWEEAEVACGESVETLRRLCRDYPDWTEQTAMLGSALLHLASLQSETGRLEDAERSLREGLEGIEQGLAAQPHNGAYHHKRAAGRESLAEVVERLGRVEEGAAIRAGMQADVRQAIARFPELSGPLAAFSGDQ